MSPLPTGLVTFLFTDIEGSTGLLQQLGPDYPRALADSRRLMRIAAEANRGDEIDCRGDEIYFVFREPADAVETAVAAQRALADHTWPQGAHLRVRMGVHTGEATLEDGDYVGLDVHLAARICDAGHGGQVLLSAATRARVPDVPIVDLGEHRLRGIGDAERIYQLAADGLGRRFPHLRGAEGVPAGLRVVLADDSVLLREGVARLLSDAGLHVAGQSGTAEDLLRHVGLYKPDVAVVDIRMPPTHTDEGLRAARTIRERYPQTAVLVLSQYVEPDYATELLADSAEGVGYLLKDRVADVEDFAAAVQRVAEGGSVLDPAVVSQLVGRSRRTDPLEELTPREREVLELMAEGRSNQAISERLFITMRAVEKHVTSIFSKLGLPATSEDHRRVLAVLAYLRA